MRNITLTIFFLSCAILVTAQSPNLKRGLSFEGGTIQPADIEAMSGKLSWYYNWGTQAESNVEGILAEYDFEYVPMTWNDGFNEENLRTFYTNHPESKYLLGFNEPNFLSQANMTPSEAAAAWPRLEALADEFGLEIVGPAVNWCGDCVSEGGVTFTNPYVYLDSFFVACPDCQVDYIAVHNYMCYTSALKSYMEGFYKYNKKIWLTEFACWDQATITLDMQKNLMFGALDYMDNDTMVYKYAWFMARSGTGTPHIDIFKSAGVPTELGEIYLNFNSAHDSLLFSPVPGRIEAETYSAGYDVQLEGTSDFDGIANVGWIDGGDWLQFNIDVAETGQYILYLRLAALTSTAAEVWIDDETSGISVDIASTGGWQNWKTIGVPVTLEAGSSKLKITTNSGGFNINWIAITSSENTAPVLTVGEDQEIDLPQSSVELIGVGVDNDNDELKYKWEKRSGGVCNILYPDSSATNVTGLVKGTYRFRLSVSDGLEVAYDEVTIKVNDPVSVEDIRNCGFKLYPNPVDGTLTIEMPLAVKDCRYEILNTSGKVLSSAQDHGLTAKLDIDFSQYHQGVYLLSLRFDDQIRVFRVLK